MALGTWDTKATRSKVDTVLRVCHQARGLRTDLGGRGGSQPASVSNWHRCQAAGQGTGRRT